MAEKENGMVTVKCEECPKRMRDKNCIYFVKFSKHIVRIEKSEPIYEGKNNVFQGCDSWRSYYEYRVTEKESTSIDSKGIVIYTNGSSVKLEDIPLIDSLF